MAKQLIISMSFDGQPEIQCMPLEFSEPGLGLGTEGITWCEQSDALLYIDDNNELMINCMKHVHVELERCGRKYVLQTDHPMRILPRDIIRIGETVTHTFHIHHIYRSNKPSARFNRLSKIAMIACATSIVMTCSTACNRPAPNNAADAIQSSEPSESPENELTETDIQLMTPNVTSSFRDYNNDQLMQLMKNREEFVDEMKANVDEPNIGTDQP